MSGSRSIKCWIVGVAVIAVVGTVVWFVHRGPQATDSLAEGNGRIEATEVDISTKMAGRLAEVLVREGDMVEANQVVARMDTKELEAQLRNARAEIARARQEEKYASAVIEQHKSELWLAEKNLGRSRSLYEKGSIALEKLQRDETALETARAALVASKAQLANAKAAIEAAVAKAQEIQTYIDDGILKSPLTGRVLYRLAEPGEVLASGGKVFTVLDLTDVYMTIFLPTRQVGRVNIGTESRIVLDALPAVAIPARVTFVAPRAQFTPKEVETQTEREKLMFRIKVKIDPELLRSHAEEVKTGLPGVAYIRIDPQVPWPSHLQVLAGTAKKDQ